MPQAELAAFGDTGDLTRQFLLTPTILELLGDVADHRVLDAGCGQGYLARILAKAKVYSCKEYQRRPEVTEEEFEQPARDLVAHPVPAGMHMFFLKADRGDRVGAYLRLWENSTEVRDRLHPPEGITAELEQWFEDNPKWLALQEKLDSLALEKASSTDYVVFASL